MKLLEVYKGHEIWETLSGSLTIRVAKGFFKGLDISYKSTLRHAYFFINGLKEVVV